MDCTIRAAKTKALISCAVTSALFSPMQIVGFLMRWLIYRYIRTSNGRGQVEAAPIIR